MALRLQPGERIIAATHNPGKAKELAALLEGQFTVITAAEAGVPEPEETETTFTGNALLKARHAARVGGGVALADDSGFCVDALDGAPGVYSARWAGPSKDFTEAMQKVEDRWVETGSEDLAAWFVCALAVAWPDGTAVVVEGHIDGVLALPPRGDRGFGYGPRCIPAGSDLTFGEMDPAEKDAISHRTRAFAALKAALID
ncbi:MAG: RdgB/HAM1 family non-canonical purine NTP pyrophosphatase [Caulobacterales bacterium]|nr:RdgB/HAM1 family non-canonical purine NTP pyrophosphatase [Caulobacterales bacterium]